MDSFPKEEQAYKGLKVELFVGYWAREGLFSKPSKTQHTRLKGRNFPKGRYACYFENHTHLEHREAFAGTKGTKSCKKTENEIK